MVNGTTRAKRTTKTLSSSQPTPSTSRPSSRSGSKSRATSCKPSLGEWSLHEECQKKEIVTLNLDSILCANTDVFGSFGPARRALRDVSEAVVKAKRTVVISGAGISCSSGIPDFRSGDGLYSLVKERYPDQFVTGKDLFSSGLFNAPETTSLFYTFIAELSTSCLKAQPTKTHQFINRLNQKGKLLRSYTQNIDGLERRVGLESGGRGLGFKKMTTKNVEMHGDLGRVRCVLCMADFEARMDWMDLFKEGSAPWCPACEERSNGRIERSARALPIGTLRPSIVLYDENHPLGEQIGDLQVFDLFRKPDLLLIMGTSLKVHGLKRVVREFAKAVHAKKGLVVFVNLTPPSKEWEDVIDVHIQGETDKWVERVEEEWRHFRPGDWEVQTTLEAEVVKNPKSKVKGKPRAKSKKSQAEPIQLPTPRPSQSPRRYDSSTFAMFDDDDLTPPPSSPLSSPPSSPRLAPLTPSKRRVNAVMTPVSDDEATRAKKRTTKPAAPVTGISATPGKGNLFTAITEDDDHWEDVINVKETSPSMQIPLERPVKAKGRAKAIIPLDKENTTPGLYAATFSPKAHRIYKTTSSDRSKRYEARVN